MNFLKNSKLQLFGICVVLASIPFLWITPGEIDLGGDSSRLYFYDPLSYLKSFPLYGSAPDSLTTSPPSYLLIPFVSLILFFKLLLGSPYLLVTLFNSFQLVMAFLSIYWISAEFLKDETNEGAARKHLTCLLAALFYILSPVLVPNGWGRALYVHVQIFVNPLIFLLLLKYIRTQNIGYALGAILVSFFFAQNFAPTPYFFSFFPIIFIYLLLYAFFVKRSIPSLRQILLVLFLFVAVQLFNFIPQIAALFNDPYNLYRQQAFSDSGKYFYGLQYFLGIIKHTIFVNNLLGLPQGISIVPKAFEFFWFVFPAILIGSLLLHGKHKNFLLLFIFYFLLLFLVTAHITDIGTKLYIHFFDIPGFAMFRNFGGQFSPTFIFFYSLLFGQALFFVLRSIRWQFAMGLCIFLASLLVVSAWSFLRGDMTNVILNKGQPVEYKITMKMDPIYERVLDYVREDPHDGRYLSLPFSENHIAMVAGAQGGMYQGPSMIAYLTGKLSISGYQLMLPFSDTFLDLARAGDYRTLENLFSLLNIKYIFYNADEHIYKYFPDFPYQHVRKFIPPDRESNFELLKNLKVKERRNFGDKYYLFEVEDEAYLPRLYIAKKIEYFNWQSYFKVEHGASYTTGAFYQDKPNYDRRTAFLEKNGKILSIAKEGKVPRLTFTKINPTRYIIHVENADSAYILVFSQAFNPAWQLFLKREDTEEQKPTIASYFDGEINETKLLNIFLNRGTFEAWGERSVADKNHLRANGYANAWYIAPEDGGGKKTYTLILEMTGQRVFYLTFFISLLSASICLGWLFKVVATVFLLKKHEV